LACHHGFRFVLHLGRVLDQESGAAHDGCFVVPKGPLGRGLLDYDSLLQSQEWCDTGKEPFRKFWRNYVDPLPDIVWSRWLGQALQGPLFS
jgi:hypothetical protein